VLNVQSRHYLQVPLILCSFTLGLNNSSSPGLFEGDGFMESVEDETILSHDPSLSADDDIFISQQRLPCTQSATQLSPIIIQNEEVGDNMMRSAKRLCNVLANAN